MEKNKTIPFEDLKKHPDFEWPDEEEPQFVNGLCIWCGETEEKCQGYKCWR
jgi:hypothetical protein